MSITTSDQDAWLSQFRANMGPGFFTRRDTAESAERLRAERPSAEQMLADPERYGIDAGEFATALRRKQQDAGSLTGNATLDAHLRAGGNRPPAPPAAQAAAPAKRDGAPEEVAQVAVALTAPDALLAQVEASKSATLTEATVALLATTTPTMTPSLTPDDARSD